MAWVGSNKVKQAGETRVGTFSVCACSVVGSSSFDSCTQYGIWASFNIFISSVTLSPSYLSLLPTRVQLGLSSSPAAQLFITDPWPLTSPLRGSPAESQEFSGELDWVLSAGSRHHTHTTHTYTTYVPTHSHTRRVGRLSQLGALSPPFPRQLWALAHLERRKKRVKN